MEHTITVYRNKDFPILGGYRSKITVYKMKPNGIETRTVDKLNFEELRELYNEEDTIGVTVTKSIPTEPSPDSKLRVTKFKKPNYAEQDVEKT